MKYSRKCLDKAFELFIEGSTSWSLNSPIPTLLDMVAIKLFLYPEKVQSTLHYGAYLVIHTALKELKIKGHVEFGNVDEFWL